MKWFCSLRSSRWIQSTNAQPGLPSLGQRMSAPKGSRSGDSQKAVFIFMKVGSPENHWKSIKKSATNSLDIETHSVNFQDVSLYLKCTVSKHPPDASEHQRCPCYINWKDLKSLHICPITFNMYSKTKLWLQAPYTPSLHRKSVNSSRSCRYVGQPAVRIHQREGIAYLSLTAGLAILQHLNSFQWSQVIHWWFVIRYAVTM